MATDTRPFNTSIPDDATFRARILDIRNSILATGMVKTADTGQIDAATAIKAASGNTVVGYDIFAFTDALQATKPWFLKIEYGSATSTGVLSIWVTMSTATNGAGTLTGNVGNRKQIVGAGAAVTIYASGDGSRLCWATIGTAVSHTWFVVMERVYDENDAVNADLLYTSIGSPNNQHQIIPRTGSVAPFVATTWPGVNLAATGGFPVLGNDVAVFPVVAVMGKFYFLGLILYNSQNTIPDLTTFQAYHRGRLRTFLALGQYSTSSGTFALVATEWE